MRCSVHAISIPCGRVAVMAVAMLLSGCTMCPDPYDYSGPVPNGSSPQNDFRARSRGILPVGAAPVPWPPIVKDDGMAGSGAARVAAHLRSSGGRHETPTLADPLVTSAADDEGHAKVEPTSVLVPTADEGACADALATEATPVPAVLAEEADEPAAPFEVTSASEDLKASEERNEGPVVASPTPPPVVVEIPTFVETPGWRPRQTR
jgi:hypothetical protein